jgi:hypothetical protein
MNTEFWNYIITFVGLLGFLLTGYLKQWWGWYVNLGNQVLWFIYSAATDQWGFFAGAIAYTVVFSLNAWRATRDHYAPKPPERIGTVEKIEHTDEGLLVTGRLFPGQHELFAKGALKGLSLDSDVPILDRTKEDK